MSYFLPSLFVIFGFKLYGSNEYKEENKGWLKLANVYLVAGIMFFIVYLGNNILGLIYHHAKAEVKCVPRDDGINK